MPHPRDFLPQPPWEGPPIPRGARGPYRLTEFGKTALEAVYSLGPRSGYSAFESQILISASKGKN
ncbi:unnamed protein product, partial [marine sediment metagenome]